MFQNLVSRIFFFLIISRASLGIKIRKQDLPLSVALNLISLQLLYGHDVTLEGKFNYIRTAGDNSYQCCYHISLSSLSHTHGPRASSALLTSVIISNKPLRQPRNLLSNSGANYSTTESIGLAKTSAMGDLGITESDRPRH